MSDWRHVTSIEDVDDQTFQLLVHIERVAVRPGIVALGESDRAYEDHRRRILNLKRDVLRMAGYDPALVRTPGERTE